ncbi:MAG: AsmA-like C-terminal domain-containing protein [Sulfurimonas sp.]
MIKTTAKVSKHLMTEILRNAVIIFVLMIITLFIGLKIGVRADNLAFGPYKVSGLYIKLDKKLVLKAHDVSIPKSKKDPSFESIDETFDLLKGLLGLFDFVSLHDINYKNNRIDFIYADHFLHINTKDYEIAGKIERKEKRFIADVPLLYLKKKKITLSGEFTYSYYADRLHAWGTYDMYGIQGKFSANKVKEKLQFNLQSETFSDLKPLVQALPLTKTVKHWSAERVLAKQYKLLSLSGRGSVIDGETFKPDVGSLKGELALDDVTIHYKDGLAPVIAQSVKMQYREGGLYFKLIQPTYKNKNLEGSRLSIINLADKNPTILKLDLRIDSPFDREVQKILQAYKLNVPVSQKSGTAKGKVALDVRLKDGKTTAAIDMDIHDALIHINKIEFPVKKGKIHFEKGIVTLDDVFLKDPMYSGKLAGEINLEKKQATLGMKAEHIALQHQKENIFELKNQTIDLLLDYTKGVKITVPQLAFRFDETEDKKGIELNFDDLSKVKPYINYQGVIQEGGKLRITTKDFRRFDFRGEMHRNTCFLFDKDDVCHDRVPVSGTLTSGGIDFYAFDSRLHYNQKKSHVTLKSINIDIEEFIAYSEKLKKKDDSQRILDRTLVILGKNSHLRYKNYTLKTDSYDVEVKPNGDLKAIGSSGGDIVKFSMRGNNISINALRIKDKILHPLINFDGLQEGRYSLKQSGNIKKTMKGRIIVEGGVMRDFKAYNNTVALINTLPSLVVLQDPGFSERGYKIKKGVAEYRMIRDEKIIFDSIFMQGASSDIVGVGQIDLKRETIDLKLAIRTAKDFGKIVGKIPLLGHILMGEDKSMTIGLRITGNLNKPKVQTSAAEEILTLPLEFFKRTLESPGEMVKKRKKGSEENPVPKKKEPAVQKKANPEKGRAEEGLDLY